MIQEDTLMNIVANTLQQARESIIQAQANPGGATEQLQQVANSIRHCQGTPEAANHTRMLEDVYQAVQHAINASGQPSNAQAVENAFNDVIRACKQAAKTYDNGIM
jgi:hypothetical protein